MQILFWSYISRYRENLLQVREYQLEIKMNPNCIIHKEIMIFEWNKELGLVFIFDWKYHLIKLVYWKEIMEFIYDKACFCKQSDEKLRFCEVVNIFINIFY